MMRYALRISAAGRLDPAAGNITWRAVAESGRRDRCIGVALCPGEYPLWSLADDRQSSRSKGAQSGSK